MSIQINELPAGSVEFMDGYYITPEAEIYRDCGNRKIRKRKTSKAGRGGYYAVLIDGKIKYIHKVYAEAYMDNYDPSKKIYFKDNNNENITLDNLTQNKKEKINCCRICPVCRKNNMYKNSDICWRCKENKVWEYKKNKKRQRNKELAEKLSDIDKNKRLTEKQSAVLACLAEGLSQSEIARRLGVSKQDINSCIKNMNIKLSKLKQER